MLGGRVMIWLETPAWEQVFFLFVIESEEQMSTLRPQFLLKFNFLIGENHLCHDLTESSSPLLLLPSRAVSDWQQ